MKLGIYGGTFSPPHSGHVGAARAFAEQMGLDELLIIPAAIPPHKEISEDDAPEKRLEMCKIAFSGIGCARVSDMEIKRGGKSYTVLTLRELTKTGRELFLLCGTDMIETLDRWYMADEIFSLCTPVAVSRDPRGEAKMAEKIAEYKEKYSVGVPQITVKTVEISSSELRAMISRGEDCGDYLSPEILAYINENKLYGAGAEK